MRGAIEANRLDILKETGKHHEHYIAPSHFRKGGCGNYRTDLPADIVADIEERFHDLQKRWGYVSRIQPVKA